MTPLSLGWWRALGLSIRGHLHGAPRIVKLAMLPMVLSVVSFMLLLSLAHLGNIRSDDSSQPPVSTLTLGSQVAYGVAKKLHASDLAPAHANSSSSVLAGYMVSVQAPSEKMVVAKNLLRTMGATIATSTSADMTLVYENARWTMSSKDPVLAVLALSSVNKQILAASGKEAVVPMEHLIHVESAIGFKKTAQTNANLRQDLRKTFLPRALAWALMAPLILMVWLSCAKGCTDVDRARASGLLESFALSPAPFHVYLLGQTIIQGLVVGGLAMAMLTIAGAFVGFMNPVSLLLVGGVFALISASLALLGALQVLWFHHRLSSMFGSLFLNPLCSPFIIAFGMVFMSGDSAVMRNATRTLQSIPLMDYTPMQALGWLGATFVVCVVFMAVLCWILEARLGPRRTGLARI